MHARTLAAAVALAAASFISTSSASAQADTARVSTALWTACPGATVRIGLQGAETVTGRCGPVADSRLLVHTADAAREISLAEVSSVRIRRRLTAEATVLLTVVGAVAGYALAPSDEKACLNETICVDDNRPAERGRGTAVGAAIGVGLGLVLGSRLVHWPQRFP